MIPISYQGLEGILQPGAKLMHLHVGDSAEPRIYLVILGRFDLDITCFISKEIRYDNRDCTLICQLKAKDTIHENLEEFVEVIKYFETTNIRTKRMNLR